MPNEEGDRIIKNLCGAVEKCLLWKSCRKIRTTEGLLSFIVRRPTTEKDLERVRKDLP